MATPRMPLIGRKKELHDVLRLFAVDGARLVTVTGPRGIGKTRFALAVADELRALGHDIVLGDDGAAVDERPVLATGGEPLGIDGERVYPLRGLPEAPAVELFRQRAPGLAGGYHELADACRRLGGVPLAIERAAALVATRTLDEAVEEALASLD